MEDNWEQEVTSEADNEAFDYIWDWEVKLPVLQKHSLFYYRTVNSTQKILNAEKIKLRLSRADFFPDKQEGIAVEVYYDLALEELLNAGLLSEKIYNRFKKVEIPKTLFMPVCEKNEVCVWKDTPYEEYIICFSTECDDQYMFEEFCKDRKHNSACEGYCLHFYAGSILELEHLGIKNYCKIVAGPVLYGRAVIDFIKGNLCRIIENKHYLKNYNYCIADILATVKFFSKLSKFKDEHEVRLVVFMPVGGEGHDDFTIQEENQQYFLYLSLEKDALDSLTPSPVNTCEQTASLINEIKNRGYEL